MYSQDLLDQIKAHCLSNTKKEMGGLLISVDKEIKLFQCANHNAPMGRFTVSAFEYLNAVDKGKLIAIYHSHFNSPEFSKIDYNFCTHERINLILYHIPTDTFNFLSPLDPPLTCLDFVKHFYRDAKLNISSVLGDDLHTELNKYNFIHTNSPKFGDLVVFYAKDKIHLGIYVNNHLFKHYGKHGVCEKEFPQRIRYEFYAAPRKSN